MQQHTPRSGAASGSRLAAGSSPSLSQASEVLLAPAFDDPLQPGLSSPQQPGQQQADDMDLGLDLTPGLPGAEEMLEGLAPQAALSLGSLGGATPGTGGRPQVSQGAVSGQPQQHQDLQEVQQQQQTLVEVQQQQQQQAHSQQRHIMSDAQHQGQGQADAHSPSSRPVASGRRAAAARRRPAAGKRHFLVDMSEAGVACTTLRPAEVRVSGADCCPCPACAWSATWHVLC